MVAMLMARMLVRLDASSQIIQLLGIESVVVTVSTVANECLGING